ncbi:hypothetical protein K458DRAFT_198087 [Lentithecium fluviatile CBS 122367]|uniref:Uncharacterized protein n=1 Tax=Lentithecium fluviatile CBS 122367 TaxID=1168545 RepID=A0A6G1J8B2_9PLEO|nr:hypothetical protein K458DRAFT_198087 [Lentithecium fluviatile CBS 122367]
MLIFAPALAHSLTDAVKCPSRFSSGLALRVTAIPEHKKPLHLGERRTKCALRLEGEEEGFGIMGTWWSGKRGWEFRG